MMSLASLCYKDKSLNQTAKSSYFVIISVMAKVRRFRLIEPSVLSDLYEKAHRISSCSGAKPENVVATVNSGISEQAKSPQGEQKLQRYKHQRPYSRTPTPSPRRRSLTPENYIRRRSGFHAGNRDIHMKPHRMVSPDSEIEHYSPITDKLANSLEMQLLEFVPKPFKNQALAILNTVSSFSGKIFDVNSKGEVILLGKRVPKSSLKLLLASLFDSRLDGRRVHGLNPFVYVLAAYTNIPKSYIHNDRVKSKFRKYRKRM